MLFAALLRCTSDNGNAIFSGNQSISFAQDSKVRAGLDGSRRVSRSRRTRRFAQDSTVRAGLDGSRRTRRFAQTELDGSRRTRRFAQDSTLLAATAPHSALGRNFAVRRWRLLRHNEAHFRSRNSAFNRRRNCCRRVRPGVVDMLGCDKKHSGGRLSTWPATGTARDYNLQWFLCVNYYEADCGFV